MSLDLGPVLESRATVHVPATPLDADVTLERGRIALRNQKADGKDALIRLRFNNPTQPKKKDKGKDEEYFDIRLSATGAAVVVDRFCVMMADEPFYDDPDDLLRKGPTAFLV